MTLTEMRNSYFELFCFFKRSDVYKLKMIGINVAKAKLSITEY